MATTKFPGTGVDVSPGAFQKVEMKELEMRSTNEESLGARHEYRGGGKPCMFRDAERLGFSAQEVSSLRRLYGDQLGKATPESG